MSAHDKFRWIRRLRKRWLILISLVLLGVSAWFIVKTEERRAALAADVNATGATRP